MSLQDEVPPSPELFKPCREPTGIPEVRLDRETLERLDNLRIEDESYDELITELINIYEAEELTLSHAGDHVGE
ncbi:hypothetical protein KY092_13050 [Natronomonas gomsonensis]|uniref:DUF7557 family protein n=1 Tax=Natronomonas gomsonensis TaxID=1046043 RepID=UPI0020CA8452|nr:hypothetical protein [Natronomonas gomsonensis]MCY4731481.1 hypothetical protein [Natronomonas gomsonensis]